MSAQVETSVAAGGGEPNVAKPAVEERASARRLYYLDALRGFCMLYGVLFHARFIYILPKFPAIGVASEYFRMPCFFLVSGYLSAMALQKRGAGAFLRGRLRALGAPLAFFLIAVNPATLYLIYVYHYGPGLLAGFLQQLLIDNTVDRGIMLWSLQLWFLIALLGYAMAAPGLARLFERLDLGQRLRSLDARLGDWSFIALALTVASLVVALRGVFLIFLKQPLEGSSIDWIVLDILNYLPYFVLGEAAYLSPELYERLFRMPAPTVVVGFGLWWIDLSLVGEASDAVVHVSYYLAKNFTVMCVISVLLCLFRALVKSESPTLSLLTRASYTVYLVQLLVIFALAALLRDVFVNPYALYAAVVVLAYPVSFALHYGLVERSPLLRFLVNGKPLRR